MKKIVSVLVASMFVAASVSAAEKIKVASVAGQQGKTVVKQTAPKAPEKQSSDYALESFGCCGLPQ